MYFAFILMAFASLASHASSSQSPQFFGAFREHLTMHPQHRAAIEAFCTSHGRVALTSQNKKHAIRLEDVVGRSPGAVVCKARSVKAKLFPKGDVYAMKIAKMNMDEEAMKMDRLQAIPDFIRCRWTCYPPARLEIPDPLLGDPRMKVPFAGIAIEYFDGIPLRNWISVKSSVLPPYPVDQRQNLLNDDSLLRAYSKTKVSAMRMWEKGWLHGQMDVGNFLYKADTGDMRIINGERSTPRDSLRQISALQYMRPICFEFQKLAFSFGISIICPEVWIRHVSVSLSTPIARTHELEDCTDISSETILQMMRAWDSDLDAVNAFCETSQPTAETLPPAFRNLLESGALEASPAWMFQQFIPGGQVSSTRFQHQTFTFSFWTCVIIFTFLCFISFLSRNRQKYNFSQEIRIQFMDPNLSSLAKP